MSYFFLGTYNEDLQSGDSQNGDSQNGDSQNGDSTGNLCSFLHAPEKNKRKEKKEKRKVGMQRQFPSSPRSMVPEIILKI